MKRLASIGSLRRLGIQAGLLAGLGLAFVGGAEKPAEAGGDCPLEAECTFKKPNFLIIVDYSSSMAEDFEPGLTRWEAAVEAINNIITTDNGFFNESMHIALMRFGHDPVPNEEGNAATENTTIDNDPGSATGFPLLDGNSFDVPWYDVDNPENGYFECNGQAITDFLDNVGAPTECAVGAACIGTWTNGAMRRAQSVITQTRVDFPGDMTPMEERFYAILLLTDGVWHGVNGDTEPGEPPEENPALTAAGLFNDDDVPTYVVAFGDAAGDGFADEIALAGGTDEAIEAGAGELEGALEQVVTDIENQIIIPQCTSGLPRIMVILDASSSMLNVDGKAGGMGATGWDQAREALAGANSIFDVTIAGLDNQPVEDLVHLGLLTFGSEEPPEESLLVDYGPCMKDNFAWALDPETSCGPGCADPWAGPPIIWSFQTPASPAYPGLDQDTYSRMPQCSLGMTPGICTGSATYTHRGLELAATNINDYQLNPPALYPISDETIYSNILITDGLYDMYSTDAQVEAALSDLYNNLSSTTYVIGFGDGINEGQLADMACWGSGGSGLPCAGGSVPHATAESQEALEMALNEIIEALNFDPCCAFNDCSFNPEPTTGEEDPMTSGSSGGSSAGDTMGLSASGTATAGESTMGLDDTAGDTAAADSTGPTPSSSSDGGPVTTMSPTTVAAEGSDDDGDTDTDTAGSTDPGSCSCSSDGSGGNGWMFGLVGLGLLGLRRRRN